MYDCELHGRKSAVLLCTHAWRPVEAYEQEHAAEGTKANSARAAFLPALTLTHTPIGDVLFACPTCHEQATVLNREVELALSTEPFVDRKMHEFWSTLRPGCSACFYECFGDAYRDVFLRNP